MTAYTAYTWARKVLLAVILLVYAYLIAEVCTRWLRPQPLLPRYTTAAPFGVRQHVPNARYQHVTGDGVTNYRINGQGLRADRDFSLTPEPGTCRIGMFGASFFMGYEVDLPDTMATQLEVILRETGYRVEVINFSLAGFGTGEMLRTYEGLGRKFGLKVAIFEWAIDDLNDNVRANLFDYRDGKVVATDRSYLPAVKLQDFLSKFALYRLLVEKSHFYSFLRERASRYGKFLVAEYRQFAQRLNSTISGDGQGLAHSSEAPAIDPVKLSAGIVRHAAKTVEADGVKFLLVEIPEHIERTKFASTLDVFGADDLKGIETLPMLAALNAASGPEIRLFLEKGHFHYSPKGNRVAADAAAHRLMQSEALATCKVAP